MESFHTGILNQNHWWHDWDECVRGIHPYAPFTLGITASHGGLRGLVNRKGGVKRYYTYILHRLE